MHWADRDESSGEEPSRSPTRETFARTAAGRVWRMLAIVLGGAVTGTLIGAPVGLAANAVGLPSGGSAAAAALAFLMIALSLRWLLLRATGAAAEVTPLFEEASEEQRPAA